ncbi:MAG: T9SS type A sorting domain-containing protein [Phaeodactylibacter sp.]|nr:T9SS type A sorting domain-containing protein [Phaeodactylibacter sp.]MCB9290818.1 T9SS type A sorting domain-containing protein [Lewinellaceae bacterium]
MKYLSTILAFSALPFFLPAQNVITGSINYEGVERGYRLYVPPAANSGQALPLVFNLHGYGSNAAQQEFYSGMNMVADTAGFFACYPNGRGSAWNVGWDFGSTADDVGFISALIDELAANYEIDPQRIYSCGMSNGGFMSYRLACELNTRIAAIASVTGSMVPSYFNNCNPGRAVPVMEIHGTADDIVPYEGEPGLSVNIDTVVHFWAENNSCDLNPAAENLPDASLLDGSTVTRFDYNDCENGHRVSLLRVIGGGHTWPGAIFNIGATNQDINASVEIWRFFSQFTLGEISSLEEAAETAPILNLFPNPTAGLIQLKPGAGPLQVIVYNAVGQPLLQEQLSGAATLDVSGWRPGIYFVEARSAKGREVFRLVKR